MKKAFVFIKRAFIYSFFTILILILFLAFNGSKNPLLNLGFYERVVTYPRSKPYTSTSWSGYNPREIIKGNKIDLPISKKEEIKISEQVFSKLDEYVGSRESTGFIVVHNDKIVHEKYFGTGGENETTDSASMAKTVLALMIAKAIEEKYILSENDLASKYITEWKDDKRNKITIKNLLQMSSGLYCKDSTTSPFSDLAKMHGGFYLPEVVLNIESEMPPETINNYNNANSQILEIILERATKKRYAQYLSEKLWQKLGSNNASLWLDHENGTPRAYCCLFANARDWAKIGLLFLHDGFFNGEQIISKEWLKKMIVPSKLKGNYGYQIWLAKSKYFTKKKISEDFLDENMIFLDGRGKQRVFIIKSKNLVAVRVGEDPKDWDESIIPNTIIRDLDKK